MHRPNKDVQIVKLMHPSLSNLATLINLIFT